MDDGLILSQTPLPLLPAGAAEIAPERACWPAKTAGWWRWTGWPPRLGCRGRGGPLAGGGAAGPAAGRVAVVRQACVRAGLPPMGSHRCATLGRDAVLRVVGGPALGLLPGHESSASTRPYLARAR